MQTMNRFQILTALFLLGSAGFCQTAQTPRTAGASAAPDYSRYRLEAIHFEGARAFSAEQLRDTFSVSTGEQFNHLAVRHGLERLRLLYGDHGYINFTAVPTLQVEQGQGTTVLLTVSIDEGAQFTFGRLVLEGQETRQGEADAMRNAWAALSGQHFDSSRLNKWLSENATFLPKDGQPPSRHVEVEMHQSLDTREADIKITFPNSKS
jgi:outer membrane protein assembly factor BamA